MDYKGLKETLEGFISRGCDQYPDQLDSLLSDTARTGIVRLPWKLLKPLLLYRLQQVLKVTFSGVASANDSQDMPQQLQDRLTKFDNPPFTIQRICELIIDPQKQYKKRDKYMRAMEKCLMVVSTQEPDLTWMKSPRLTQLLEEPPKDQPVLTNSNHHDSYSSSQEEEDMITEQPSSQSDLTTPGMDTLPPPNRESNATSQPESSTTFEPSPVGGDERRLSGTPRKRTSSVRDSLEEGMEQDEEMSPVLQEADSTTVSEPEQLPQVAAAVKFERQNSIPHTEDETERGGEELEQGGAKRMRPSSPTPVFTGGVVGVAEVEAEVERKRESIAEIISSDQEQQQTQQQKQTEEREESGGGEKELA